MSTQSDTKAAASRRDGKPKRGPGRPRDSSYDAVILREVLREISAEGIKGLSVQRVADRAGVAKATVRLRWPNRLELILAALETTTAMLSRPETGTLRGDLEHVVREYADVYRTEELMRLYSYVQAEQNHNPAFLERFQAIVAQPANQIVIDALVEAQLRGQARKDVDVYVVARCLVGSLYLEGITKDSAITVEFEQQLVEFVLAAIEVTPSVRVRAKRSPAASA
jgi:AcrR family transcriptional regulator